jgi:hypothetical protein
MAVEIEIEQRKTRKVQGMTERREAVVMEGKDRR